MAEDSLPSGEDDYFPLSALQHFVFCPRQCALIHIECLWQDNRLTAEGKAFHDRVHDAGAESRGDLRLVRGLKLSSRRFGLMGVADLVEFHFQLDGSWQAYPVEYKRGRSKRDDCDRIQLCAQAVCLEEMLGRSIPEGALYYLQSHQREVVPLNASLRSDLASAVEGLRRLLKQGQTPPPTFDKKCQACSLVDDCRPRWPRGKHIVRDYLNREAESD